MYTNNLYPGFAYSNYYSYPDNIQSSYSSYPSSTQANYVATNNQSDDRLLGAGLIAPFLLGGIAGAAVAPYFYRPYYGCCPYPPYPPYYPYPRY